MPGPAKLPDLPLWEARWTKEALAAKRAEDARMFARGFRLLPFSDEERAFPSLASCYAHGVVLGDIARNAWPKFLGVDLAGEQRAGTALVAIALDPQSRRRTLVRVVRGAWTSPQAAEQIVKLDAELGFAAILVESNAYQKALVDWLKHAKAPCWSKVRPFVTTARNKMDPTLGVRGLEIEFANKAWVIPADEFEAHPLSCVCGWCAWRREMEDYPLGASDDLVMSTFFARQCLDIWIGGRFGPTRIEGLGDR